MRSIFVLNNHGVSMTILKKLHDMKITYLDLEFFGESILKQNKISKSQTLSIMDSFNKSKEDNINNTIIELQYYGLSRNYVSLLQEKKISFEDLQLSLDDFCNKYNVKRNMYIEVQNAYQNFKNNNNNIIKENDYSKYLLEIIKQEASIKSIEIAKLIDILIKTTYPINYLNSDIDILIENELVECCDNKISIILPSVVERINELDDRKKGIILKRLDGLTLQEIADDYDLTRERIRQIIEKTYQKLCNVKEDKYKDIYEKYELSEEQFTIIFDEPKSTYYYLFDKYKKGILEYTELQNKYYTSETMLKRIRSLQNEICINDVFINEDRNGVTKYYLKYRCREEISISDLFKLLNTFIINELSNYKIDSYDTEHNLEALLSRKSWCVFGKNKKIRYYEMDLLSEEDMQRLYETLDVEYGLYSSLYFYENNLDLMEQLDIRNEQELHNIYRNLINNTNITFLRMPNILIGYQDKKDFIIDKMTELSPIQQSQFLNIMRSDYGHREDTMLSYLNLEFNEYLTGSQIVSKVVDISISSLKTLISKLTKYVYTINEFNELLKETNIEDYSQLLNNINLKKLNYKIVGSYVIKNTFSTLEDAFYNAVIKGELNHSFIGVNSTSYALIYKLEIQRKIIEIDDKYYPFESIYNLGLTKNEVDSLLIEIKVNFSKENYYFTTKTIRDIIQHEAIKENILNDSIIKSLIKLLKDFKKISWHDNTVFCYSPEATVSRKTFLYEFIKKNNGISLSFLQQKLFDDYGISLNQEQIKYVIYNLDILTDNNHFFVNM